jgi:hypothetical protein
VRSASVRQASRNDHLGFDLDRYGLIWTAQKKPHFIALTRIRARLTVSGEVSRVRTQQAQNPVLERIRNERGIAGEIARECGITREAVWLWRRVPSERVLTVERVTGIPRHLIRPRSLSGRVTRFNDPRTRPIVAISAYCYRLTDVKIGLRSPKRSRCDTLATLRKI